MNVHQYQFLENLQPHAKNIRFSYNTNLNTLEYKGKSILDLWKNFKHLSNDKVDLIKKKYGKFILFSSDYSFTRRSNIYSFLRYLEEYNWIKESSKYKFVKNQAYQTYNEFKENMNFFKKLDNLQLDFKIIIRPHPADDRKHWTKLSQYF